MCYGVLQGDCRFWGCAMREWWRSSDVVFKVLVAIIVVELVLLFIGLDLASSGVEPVTFSSP
jgi:hypothetical protein